MISDAAHYSEHRSMQMDDTTPFLSSIVRRMDWSQEDQDVVMDIGCGSGDSCRKMLLPVFPRVKKVVAIDVLPDMIKYANENNADEKIEYHVADIEDISSLKQWTQKITKVISICCIHWLKDQRNAFNNMHRMMKPGAQAALLFVTESKFWDSYSMFMENPKWMKYLENAETSIPESHFKKYGASYYENMLQDIGFNVITCEEKNKTFVYKNDEDFQGSCFAICGLAKYIPDQLKEEFKKDVLEGSLKYNERQPDGRPALHYTILNMLIQKPFI